VVLHGTLTYGAYISLILLMRCHDALASLAFHTGMNITIRRGVPADAASLADLAARTFHDTFAADSRPEDMALHLAQAYGPLQQGRELADPNVTTLLVDADGQLVGYAQLRGGPAPPCVDGDAPIELWRFYFALEWHGRGLAQTLMQRVDAEARRTDARTLWLGVWERNERAKAFYRKCNFVDVGAHVFMVGTDAQTDRILVRPVAPAAMANSL
jgi:GNAT superfamily N-acetyltransferase